MKCLFWGTRRYLSDWFSISVQILLILYVLFDVHRFLYFKPIIRWFTEHSTTFSHTFARFEWQHKSIHTLCTVQHVNTDSNTQKVLCKIVNSFKSTNLSKVQIIHKKNTIELYKTFIAKHTLWNRSFFLSKEFQFVSKTNADNAHFYGLHAKLSLGI